MVTSSASSKANPALRSAAAGSATTPIAGAAASPASGASAAAGNSALSLTPTDFINMMITQLKNQDPMQPTSNSDLLAQVSQIGQLQSQSTLQTSLQGMVLQNQIGSASNLIGKSVQGLDTNNNPIQGTVNSVHVQTDGVSLELDNGVSLPLARVTDIHSAQAAATSGAATSAATTSGAAATAPPAS